MANRETRSSEACCSSRCARWSSRLHSKLGIEDAWQEMYRRWEVLHYVATLKCTAGSFKLFFFFLTMASLFAAENHSTRTVDKALVHAYSKQHLSVLPLQLFSLWRLLYGENWAPSAFCSCSNIAGMEIVTLQHKDLYWIPYIRKTGGNACCHHYVLSHMAVLHTLLMLCCTQA